MDAAASSTGFAAPTPSGYVSTPAPTYTYTPTAADLATDLAMEVTFEPTAIAGDDAHFALRRPDDAAFADVWGYGCTGAWGWAGDCSLSAPGYISACPVPGRAAVGPDGSTCEVGIPTLTLTLALTLT